MRVIGDPATLEAVMPRPRVEDPAISGRHSIIGSPTASIPVIYTVVSLPALDFFRNS